MTALIFWIPIIFFAPIILTSLFTVFITIPALFAEACLKMLLALLEKKPKE